MALEDYCEELSNYFIHDMDEDIYLDTYTISDGVLSPLSFISDDQYFRIIGSVFNDGVYKKGETLSLTDEEFEGAVWRMYVPSRFVALTTEADAYLAAHPDTTMSSESFGGYSYNKMSNYGESIFDYLPKSISDKLKVYRKLRF